MSHLLQSYALDERVVLVVVITFAVAVAVGAENWGADGYPWEVGVGVLNRRDVRVSAGGEVESWPVKGTVIGTCCLFSMEAAIQDVAARWIEQIRALVAMVAVETVV